MNYWVYKCNINKGNQNPHDGDWNEVIDEVEPFPWEKEGRFPKGVENLKKGHIIIAQQKRNNVRKISGIAKVHSHERDLYLKWLYTFEEEVPFRKLRTNLQVARIKAFTSVEVKTVYDINAKEVRILLSEIAKTLSLPKDRLFKAAQLG